MGMPGSVTIKISTTFDEGANSVSRSIQFIKGNGLNSLVLSDLGSEKSWDINKDIMVDTIGLPDGIHTLDYQHAGWVVIHEEY